MIYAIGDLHFDNSKTKPMDIFGDNWIDHEENIMSNWKELVKDDDLVIIPGDISWALKLGEAVEDLKKIEELPGKKVLVKGNHDYWWAGLKKLNDLNLKDMFFLQNNSYVFNNIGICGTRGWQSPDEDSNEHDEKILKRELGRLRLSLEDLRSKDANIDKIIVILHYPPFNLDLEPNEFVEIMKEFNVDICLYGHLHSEGHRYVVEGNIEGIDFFCVSSDYIGFIPKSIIEE